MNMQRSSVRSRIGVAVALPVALLSGCATLAPGDRAELCAADVVQTNAATVKSNPFAAPGAGPVLGAVAGVAFFFPIGVVAGAIYGSACSVSTLTHPTAEADFAKVALAADASRPLPRGLAVALQAPREACTARAPVPRVTVEVEQVALQLDCAMGLQNFDVSVHWRVVKAPAQVLAEETTRCFFTSSRESDEWFADLAFAQTEVEGALERAGQHIANQLLSSQGKTNCRL